MSSFLLILQVFLYVNIVPHGAFNTTSLEIDLVDPSNVDRYPEEKTAFITLVCIISALFYGLAIWCCLKYEQKEALKFEENKLKMNLQIQQIEMVKSSSHSEDKTNEIETDIGNTSNPNINEKEKTKDPKIDINANNCNKKENKYDTPRTLDNAEDILDGIYDEVFKDIDNSKSDGTSSKL